MIALFSESKSLCNSYYKTLYEWTTIIYFSMEYVVLGQKNKQIKHFVSVHFRIATKKWQFLWQPELSTEGYEASLQNHAQT